MELIEFKQIANILGIKVNKSLERTLGEMRLGTQEKYFFQCNGITFTYKNDKNGSYISATGVKINNFSRICYDVYGIKQEIDASTKYLRAPVLTNSYRIDNIMGVCFLILMSAPVEIETLEKAKEVFAGKIAKNLRIAQPQEMIYSMPNTPTKEQSLRTSLKLFDDSINPYVGENLDAIDYKEYPPTLHIFGSKDNLTSNLIITDLKTKTNVKHTVGKEGIRNLLTWFNGDKVAAVEHSYSTQSNTEFIIIKINADSEVEYDITRHEIKKATGNFAECNPETIERNISTLLNSCLKIAKALTDQCVPTSIPRKRQA